MNYPQRVPHSAALQNRQAIRNDRVIENWQAYCSSNLRCNQQHALNLLQMWSRVDKHNSLFNTEIPALLSWTRSEILSLQGEMRSRACNPWLRLATQAPSTRHRPCARAKLLMCHIFLPTDDARQQLPLLMEFSLFTQAITSLFQLCLIGN